MTTYISRPTERKALIHLAAMSSWATKAVNILDGDFWLGDLELELIKDGCDPANVIDRLAERTTFSKQYIQLRLDILESWLLVNA